MKTSATLAHHIAAILIPRVADCRAPDFVVGADSPGGAYLRRWYLTPWRRLQGRLRDRAEAQPTRWNRATARVVGLLPNLYLHQFLRDDDDRALHDHPSWAVSYMLRGGYIEHTIAAGGIHHRTAYHAGSLRFLGTRFAHRIELFKQPASELGQLFQKVAVFFGIGLQVPAESLPCWTLFLFGPTVRDWGFHCPDRGWVHWREFTKAGKPGEVGQGCDA
ncbi:hypothetical protein [Lysobacter brunescens]|uniref:DUF4166 domain-containing protein n=1 Tax=Lysobacter brunescens TaxID=262323 RepID=A0ABW2YFS0_9GAMM